MDTRPAMAPFRMANRSMRPSRGRDTARATITPAAAARFVLTMTMLMATASLTLARPSCDPPLNPIHPNQRMNTPRVTSRILEGGVARTVPSARNLPSRGPTTSMPARAAHPPVLWTMVEPAKSEKPSWLNHPPPQVQAPTTG